MHVFKTKCSRISMNRTQSGPRHDLADGSSKEDQAMNVVPTVDVVEGSGNNDGLGRMVAPLELIATATDGFMSSSLFLVCARRD